MEPREISATLEAQPEVPDGVGDRFAGYAVIGLPFLSGHVLALRRFPASSIGPGYTSVWHRTPQCEWTMYSTVSPELGCARYFGREVTHNVVAPIRVDWTEGVAFRVSVGTSLRWDVKLESTLATRLLNTVGACLPDAWWSHRPVLSAMGEVVRLALGSGRLNLAGRTPNGQQFVAKPRQLWLIHSSRAILNGADLGPTGPLEKQAALNDVLIPQRGLFAVTNVTLEKENK